MFAPTKPTLIFRKSRPVSGCKAVQNGAYSVNLLYPPSASTPFTFDVTGNICKCQPSCFSLVYHNTDSVVQMYCFLGIVTKLPTLSLFHKKLLYPVDNLHFAKY